MDPITTHIYECQKKKKELRFIMWQSGHLYIPPTLS